MKKSTVILIRNAAPTDFGGGERVPVFIAREVLKEGQLKPVVFSGSQKLLDFAKTSNVPFKKTWWWTRQNWSGKRALLFPIYLMWQFVLFIYYTILFIRFRPLAVHLQSKDDFIAGTFAAKLIGSRVVWSDYADLKHIFKNHKIWHKNPIGKLVYFSARFASTIIVVSEEDKRLIIENISDGAIKSKLDVIYNGAFDSYKKVVKQKEFTIISTGRLVTDKGIGELIEAFKKFQKEEAPSARLELLGDGPERKLFEEQAKSVPNIDFLGYQKDPLEFVAKAHVFVLPTYHEGFSLALVEACMLEMPIIATSIGGNLEIISDNDNGILIPIRDAESLHSALLKLYKDKVFRQSLAKKARYTYESRFDFEKIIAQELIPLYGDV